MLTCPIVCAGGLDQTPPKGSVTTKCYHPIPLPHQMISAQYFINIAWFKQDISSWVQVGYFPVQAKQQISFRGSYQVNGSVECDWPSASQNNEISFEVMSLIKQLEGMILTCSLQNRKRASLIIELPAIIIFLSSYDMKNRSGSWIVVMMLIGY